MQIQRFHSTRSPPHFRHTSAKDDGGESHDDAIDASVSVDTDRLTRWAGYDKQDAETLTALVGQVGTLVLDHSGNVLSSTGQLTGAAGENAAKTVLATLQVSI